jgi:hypothetical protein
MITIIRQGFYTSADTRSRHHIMIGEGGEMFVDGRCTGRIGEPSDEAIAWARGRIKARFDAINQRRGDKQSRGQP